MANPLAFCKIEIRDGITVVTFLEEPNSDMSRMILQHLADENIYHYRVFDFNDFDWHFSHQDVIDLANFSKSIFKEKNFTCFAAPNDLAFATLRELSVYREEEGHVEVGVFRTIDESIDWMKAKKAQEEGNYQEPI